MINAPKLEIGYKLKNWTETQETITFYKQKIVDNLWEVTKFEVLSQVPSKCFDILMEEISDEDKYKIDMDILREMLLYIRTHNITYNLSINLNPSTLINKSFLEDMYKIFSFHKKKDIARLEFEITENWYFNSEEIKVLNENISKIQKLWIKIWIDDYPNLNNNNELLDKIKGLDFVKIDKAFLLDYRRWFISLDELIKKVEKFVFDIKARAWSNITIVMEWVESEDLFNILSQNFSKDIQLFQGYFFHKRDFLE